MMDNDTASQLRAVGHYLIALANGGAAESSIEPQAIPLPQAANYLAQTNDDLMLSRIAADIYDQRRKRDHFLSSDLFAEPAWDLLLDLFVARVAASRISITSACIAASVPDTTAFRWVGILIERGLIERSEDRLDKRRHWIELSDAGFRKMRTYLEWVAYGSSKRGGTTLASRTK
jgi:hypothetical protein